MKMRIGIPEPRMQKFHICVRTVIVKRFFCAKDLLRYLDLIAVGAAFHRRPDHCSRNLAPESILRHRKRSFGQKMAFRMTAQDDLPQVTLSPEYSKGHVMKARSQQLVASSFLLVS